MDTYLFYDIETTGLNKAFDQVLHFAAIRTDRELIELERYEIKIRLNPDVTPSPAAIITHHMGLKEIAYGICEYEGIQKIHYWLNLPGTISLGYNTLRFDDEFLRFSFYRNLLPPYTHQYANRCGRMDLYPMTVMYFLFKNTALTWPIKEGKPSFKLADLSSQNQLAQGRAHHAMVDVEATLALARILFKEYDMWHYLTGYFNKEQDMARLREVQNAPALMVDGILGSQKHYQSPVLFLGMHQHYKNQMVWLHLDHENLTKTTSDTLLDVRVTHKKIGEPSFILPCKERFLQYLAPERKAQVSLNQEWIKQNPDIFSQLIHFHTHYQYPIYPETDVAASLYLNGFWNPQEESICRKFHTATGQQKAQMIDQIQNERLQMLALRILGNNYPEALTNQQSQLFADYMTKMKGLSENKIIDYQGKKQLTPKDALSEITALRQNQTLTPVQFELLNELEGYLSQW